MRKIVTNLSTFTRNHLRVIKLITGVIAGLVLLVVGYNVYLINRFVPNVYVVDRQIGFLGKDEAIEKIKVQSPEMIRLQHEDLQFELNLDDIGFEYDYTRTVDRAYSAGRNDGIVENLVNKTKSVYQPTHYVYDIKVNNELLEEYLSVIAAQLSVEPVLPTIGKSNNQMVVTAGAPGSEVDLVLLKDNVLNNLKTANFQDISIELNSTPALSDYEIENIQKKSNLLIDKSITATHDRVVIEFNDEQLAQSLLPQNGITYLVSHISKQTNRPPQNAIFIFEGNRVKEFKPGLDGLEVIESELNHQITQAIVQLSSSDASNIQITIPVRATSPNITNDKVNDLGIKELLGRGSSRFAGSIPSRVHNVGVASASFNGILVPPSETISFNNIVGDISTLTGYQQAYIIKDGATVLGDGGGVCQVSTTLFRAALDAGLPIIERSPHSYRVTYYEQGSPPGIDATIFSPTTDLKIANDTPAHLLIQTFYNAADKTLDFEIYGTSDGRVSTISDPVITSSSPPPEDLYIDDPNLKIGEVKQIDWKAWGAKVHFDYKVERDGKVIYEKTFHSNYRPWQAKFLRGTAPIQ